MKYSEINIIKIDLNLIIKELEGNTFIINSREKKELLKNTLEAIKRGRYKTSINGLVISLFLNKKKTFDKLRKGIFRYSSYISEKSIINNLSKEILKTNEKLNKLNDIEIKFFTSKTHISHIHTTYSEINLLIKKEINAFYSKNKQKSLVKSLLSYTDYLFLSHYQKKENKTNQNTILSRSVEEISSATSYLLYLVLDELSIKDTLTYISEEYISNGIEFLLNLTCSFIDFKELEVLIDHYDYYTSIDNGDIILHPPFTAFEKAIRIGYIKREIQTINDLISFSKDDSNDNLKKTPSIIEVSELLNKEKDLSFFEYTEDNNYPRYRLKIPQEVLNNLINKYFSQDFLFQEEIIYLMQIVKEQLIDYDDFTKFELRPGFTLFDFIKINRVFNFLFNYFSENIYKQEKILTDNLLHSLIPIIPEVKFYEIFKGLMSDDKIDTYFDLMSWEPNVDTKLFFDIQYTPILFLNGHFLIPFSIITHSNSIRNLYAAEYKRGVNKQIFKNGKKDSLVLKLEEIFNNNNVENYSEVKYPNTDIDLISIIGDTLFIFECKHSLHPTSVFDLRTTYDYIRKAEKQLSNLHKDYEENRLLKHVENSLNIDLSKINNVKFSIITSNRIFVGNAFKYPIRYIYEVGNFISKGLLKTEFGNFSLWKNETISKTDIVNFFDISNSFFDMLYNSLYEDEVVYNTITPNIRFKTYYLDEYKANTKLKEYTSKLRKYRMSTNANNKYSAYRNC